MKLVIVCIIIVLIGCSKRAPIIKINEYNQWELAGGDNILDVKFYNDTIFSLVNESSNFTIYQYSIDGKEKSRFHVSKGKGPSDLIGYQFSMYVSKYIYIFSFRTLEVKIYTLLGQFVDTIPIDARLGLHTPKFAVSDDKLIFHNLGPYYLAIFDKTGRLLNSIDNKSNTEPHGYIGGELSVDMENNIYIGYYSRYLIEKYSIDLTLLESVEKKDAINKNNPLTFKKTSNGSIISSGEICINSLLISKNSFFIAYGAGWYISTNSSEWYYHCSEQYFDLWLNNKLKNRFIFGSKSINPAGYSILFFGSNVIVKSIDYDKETDSSKIFINVFNLDNKN